MRYLLIVEAGLILKIHGSASGSNPYQPSVVETNIYKRGQRPRRRCRRMQGQRVLIADRILFTHTGNSHGLAASYCPGPCFKGLTDFSRYQSSAASDSGTP